MPRERVADLNRYIVSRGWMSLQNAEKTRLLCELGLHPEQALVGTGMLGADEYEEAMSQMDGPNFSVEAIHELPVIRSSRLLRTILDAADAAETHHVYLEQGPHGSDVILSHDIRQEPDFSFPSGPFAALRLRLRRTASASGWNVEEREKGNGFTMLLSRSAFDESAPHALDASDVWNSFWQNPQGLLVLQGQNPTWRQVMESPPESAICFEASDAASCEEALHAALAGKTVLAHTPPSAESWWEAGAEAGIPVRVIAAREHLEGTSWEAHQL